MNSASSITVEADGKQITVLLAEIQAPNYNQRSPAESEPFGVEAREFLREKIAGRQLQIEVVKELAENRVLAFCFISTALINAEVVKAGFAAPRQQILAKFVAEHKEPTDLQSAQQVVGLSKDSGERIVEAFFTAKYIKLAGMHASKAKQYSFEDLTVKSPKIQQFVDKFKNTQLTGCVEYIRDGESFYVQCIH